MSYHDFQEICAVSPVERERVEEIFLEDPTIEPRPEPTEYTEEFQEIDACRILGEIFGDEGSLNMDEISTIIIAQIALLRTRFPDGGPVFGTIAKIQSAVSRAAADAFRSYCKVTETNTPSPEVIMRDGKPSPYGKLMTPIVKQDESGNWQPTGEEIPMDFQAAGAYYKNDLLALFIAREYEIEETLS